MRSRRRQQRWERATCVFRRVRMRWHVLLSALVSVCFGVDSAAAVRAQSSPFANRQLVYGPLACAADSAYHEWLSGPLAGTPPAPTSFSATMSATADPYTISFTSTSGNTPAKATYAIASSTCLSSSWPSVPASDQFPKGPLTLSGSYVLALVAADAVHSLAEPKTFDPENLFAYLNSPGSGVVIATLPATSNRNILVGFNQYYVKSSAKPLLGCYKEQQYLVNPITFAASQTRIGCPG